MYLYLCTHTSNFTLQQQQQQPIINRWIIAVPNEWTMTLRQMVRMAAEEAGITNCNSKKQQLTTNYDCHDDNLLLVSDIEAASYHCMSTKMPTTSIEPTTFIKPRLDLVILCNNCSLSWCLMKSSSKSNHVDYVCIEDWREHSVNLTNEFLCLIINLFGMEFVQYYRYSQPKAFLQLLESFELSVDQKLLKRNNNDSCDNDAIGDECKLKYNQVFTPIAARDKTNNDSEFDLSKHSIEIQMPVMFVETFKNWTCYTNNKQQDHQQHNGEDAHVFLSHYLMNLNQNNTGIRYDPDAKLIYLNFEAMIVIYAPLIDAITNLIGSTHSTYTINQNLGLIENVFVVGCGLIKHEPIVRLSIEENLRSYHVNNSNSIAMNLHMISSEAVTMGACIFHLANSFSNASHTNIISPSNNNSHNVFINGWPCLNSLGVGVISYLQSGQTKEQINEAQIQWDILDRMIHVGEIVTKGQVVFRNYYKRAVSGSDEPILVNIYTTQTKVSPTIVSNDLTLDSRIMHCLASLKFKYSADNYPRNSDPLFELELTARDRAQFELKIYQVRFTVAPKTDGCSTFNLMRVGDHCLKSLIIDMNV